MTKTRRGFKVIDPQTNQEPDLSAESFYKRHEWAESPVPEVHDTPTWAIFPSGRLVLLWFEIDDEAICCFSPDSCELRVVWI